MSIVKKVAWKYHNITSFDKFLKSKEYLDFEKLIINTFSKFEADMIFTVSLYDGNTPLYSPSYNAIFLSINIEETSNDQIIFQLSHEIIHKMIYEIANIHKYIDVEKKKSEVICTAFSLYSLFICKKYIYLENYLSKKPWNLYDYWRDEIIEVFNSLVNNFDNEIIQKISDAVTELKEIHKV